MRLLTWKEYRKRGHLCHCGCYAAYQDGDQYLCTAHGSIDAVDAVKDAEDAEERFTEADYQTWMRV